MSLHLAALCRVRRYTQWLSGFWNWLFLLLFSFQRVGLGSTPVTGCLGPFLSTPHSNTESFWDLRCYGQHPFPYHRFSLKCHYLTGSTTRFSPSPVSLSSNPFCPRQQGGNVPSHKPALGVVLLFKAEFLLHLILLTLHLSVP